ncbi:early transcribed membrane protein [Plasmodium yoelii]|uniref:Early transcribed membrane protein family n=3 Tax=Plasmodium yoelii TaxID=5861 RepID=Q7RFA8_PLAYO|nr:early transcribed membrane protein [Plasmodium yoelii]EAA16712.1 early transcribed membrane protein family [Plasmodium yoelii yoelii]WBY55800.1 early transcribed membrane protein [Plasmodium yoelii yoelii]CDU16848.1 early transcribed membrane protein [Plasmodium yoelii]VTZ74522.1 early transcribed membrane protein [Plasmodium yoelii]|eukprot:XP_725147.1 early transcribed membrane protein [Plasmodium yoelii]
MKLAKALYFVAFLLAIKVLTPGSNNYVEAKPANTKKVTKSADNAFIKKIKNKKVALISTIAATLALAIATTFGVMHFQKKQDDKKEILESDGKTPLITPRSNSGSDNKNTPPAPETNTKSAPETNTKSAPETNTKPTLEINTKPVPEINTKPVPEINTKPTLSSGNSRAYPPASH